MSPKDIVVMFNKGMGNLWLLTSIVLLSTHHWIGGGITLVYGIYMIL